MSHVLLVLTTTAPLIAVMVALPRPAPRLPPRSCAHVTTTASARTWSTMPATTALRLVSIGAALRGAAEALTVRVSRRRTRRSAEAALPDAIELLVLAVHAGATPTRAIHDVQTLVAPVLRPAFGAVVHRLQRGQRLADAVAAIPELLGPRAGALADGIAAADRYGLPLGPVLDALATEARAERRRIGEAQARSLSVKLTFPLVSCTLPAFVLVAIVPAVLGSLGSLPTLPGP